MKTVGRFVVALIFWIIVAVIAYFAFALSGTYQVGADVPHWGITRHAIGLVRERAVEHRLADITVPSLQDPAMIKEGAEHYAEMCTGCHLAPGMGSSELREGLYPRPPNLTRFAPDPAEAFWIIKHGLKMTAMPAWGKSHTDQQIWAMVAYLQKQPQMSAAEFQALTAHAADVEDHHTGPGEALPPPPMSMGPPASPAAPASTPSGQ